MRISTLVLLLVSLSTGFAFADSAGLETLYFTYSGADIEDIGAISSGVGYLAFPSGLKTVSLSNVVAFEFFQTTTLLGISPSDNIFRPSFTRWPTSQISRR